jgi:hypothetical protein
MAGARRWALIAARAARIAAVALELRVLPTLDVEFAVVTLVHIMVSSSSIRSLGPTTTTTSTDW